MAIDFDVRKSNVDVLVAWVGAIAGNAAAGSGRALLREMGERIGAAMEEADERSARSQGRALEDVR